MGSIYIYIYILTPLHKQDVAQANFNKFEFRVFLLSCYTMVKEPSLPYHLPIPGERIVGFFHFPKVLVLCEMQTALSKI